MTRRLLPVLALVASTAVAGQAPPTPGRLVAAGVRSWWLSCTGVGTPLVLLEAGHTESSSSWRDVQPRVAEFTRVCSYDRAGRGRSAPAPVTGAARTGSDVVRDLRELLGAADERGPLVLVGHSLGGAFVRLFAATSEDTVAGMVLVDAVHERELEAIDGLLTPQQRAAAVGMRPMSPEGLDVEEVLREVREGATSMGWPLVVVARGRPLGEDEMPPSWSPVQRRERELLRRALQQELARLAPEGRLVVAEGSGHHVHNEKPEIVVDAIRDLVVRHRQRASR